MKKVITLTESELINVIKKTIQSSNLTVENKTVSDVYPYAQLSKNPKPSFIADVIKKSKGGSWFINDKEAWAEAAFMAIKNQSVYKQVQNFLGEDVYSFIEDFMDTKTKYHKKSVYDHYKTLFPDVLKTYLSSTPSLIPLYKEIENKLGDKFKKKHFDQEIKYSGGLKSTATGLSQNTLKNLNKLLLKYGLKGKVTVDADSFRDYKKQKDVFIRNAVKHGGSIDDGLRQAALPGFSQHHTGKALDISGHKFITDDMLKSFGFRRPYKNDTGFRMPEPWHIISNT